MIQRWLFHRRSVLEVLVEIEKSLPLRNACRQKLPMPLVAGDYFGFQLTLEGGKRKEGYRFLGTIVLPKPVTHRVFLAHEKRKTSLKPVADLKLVSTPHALFNQNYLLLASDEAWGARLFQSYLCGKLAALPAGAVWQLDVHEEEAHLELSEQRLNAAHLCEVLRAVMEVLNVFICAGGSEPK